MKTSIPSILSRYISKVLWALSGIVILTGLAIKEAKAQYRYFNTARTQPIAGVLLNDPSQINEVAGFSNAAAFWTTDFNRLTVFLQQNRGRMLPVIELRGFVFNPATGVVRTDYLSVIKKLAQTVASSHSGPVLFFIDEPFWNIRISCHGNKLPQACAEVRARYANTLNQLRIAGRQLRQALPGSGIFEIEAFSELAIQQSQWGQLVMLDDAEYLGFDCYGKFNSCGGGVYAGVSVGPKPMSTYIDWVSGKIASLEKKKPIGRKIILVPGAFMNTLNFTSEQQTIDQLKSYLNTFYSCHLCTGFMPFLWGNLPDVQDTIVGARSLPNVRPAVVEVLRSLTYKPYAPLPPAMTLAGGYKSYHGPLYTSLGTSVASLVGAPATGLLLGIPHYLIPQPAPPIAVLTVPVGASGQIYVTNVGMTFCTINIGNEAPRYVAANTFTTINIFNITRPTSVKATCASAGDSHSRYFLFKVK